MQVGVEGAILEANRIVDLGGLILYVPHPINAEL